MSDLRQEVKFFEEEEKSGYSVYLLEEGRGE